MKLSIVYTGDVKSGTAPMEIESGGIGSCVVLVLYDKNKKNGGMAHIMLPEVPESESHEKELMKGVDKDSHYMKARYAPEGVEILFKELRRLGSDVESLEATLVGGAEMFPDIVKSNRIGDKNVEVIKNILKENGIPVIKEDTGGESGRSMSFSLDKGIVTSTKNSDKL